MKNNFNKFDDISHLPLRVYNRVVLLNNLHTDFGPQAAKEYIELFNEGERKQMYIMQAHLKNNGVEAVKKEVTKGLSVVGGEDE